MQINLRHGFAALGLLALVTAPQQAEAGELTVKWDDGLKMQTEDKSVKLQIFGRIQSDWAVVDEDADVEEALGNQFGGHEFRRARLGIKGELWNSVLFKAEYDFASEGIANYADVYVGLKGAFGQVLIGHQKHFRGLEELTSSRFITFMERGLPTVLDDGRDTGITWKNNFGPDGRVWAGFGVFKTTDAFGEARIEENFAIDGRVTGAVLYADDGKQVLHVGGTYSYIDPGEARVTRLRQRPEIHLTDRYVDTGNIEGVDSGNYFGFEAAFVYGPFSAQTEYKYLSVSREFELEDEPGVVISDDPSFDSFYIYGSYFLTGESRKYKTSKGAFDRVKPAKSLGKGGMGAWEVGFRYSTIDLNDGLITGGKLDNITVGLNWYLNPNTRFQFNWVNADLEDVGKTNGIMARFQVDF